MAMKFSKFIESIEDVALVERFSERVNRICGEEFQDLTFLPYKLLKDEIPELIKQHRFEEAIWEIVKVRKKTVKFRLVKKTDNYTKLKFYFWIKDQYRMIHDLERQYLVTPPDPKLVNAGLKELDILGDINIIDTLAGGDILKWEAIRELPYSQIFDKQLKMTIESKIAKRLKQNQNG